MASPATEFQRSSSPPLPADHVLNSGAVIFPGAFDQHGCPLVVFPAGAQQRLPDLGEEDVANFIHYFLRAHNKHQEKGSLVSLVADLRQATVPTARFVADLLLLLELNKRTVHTLYVVQPKKRDVLKLLTKALVPSGSKQYIAAPFKRVVLKELFELSNHIDRSQLTASLGGYLVYCHRSWVTFVKEIDAFVQEFLLVVQKLPSCISTLQAISQQPVPSDFEDLTDFCLVNEARFHELRRELGLDVLLRHCEGVVAKLRYPENAPCYQAMAGTSIFVQTSLDMLQNYSRITSAVEKVELLWKRAFSKARLQLHVLQLQREAQQITEQMASLRTEKLQPHAVEIAKDAARAEQLMLEFETSTYASAMVLAHRAEDVIHKTTMVIPLGEALHGEGWVDELEGLKESFCSAVELLYQTLRAVANFHRGLSRAKAWYSLVLCQNFLQDLLCGGTCDTAPKLQSPLDARPGLPVWKQAVGNFLKRNPSPETEELVQLAHLANVIPEAKLQQSGKQLSHRCMILRKLLTCPGAVSLHDLKLALQWQYDFLSSNCQNIPDTPLSDRNESDGIHFQRGAGVASVPREQSFASNLRHMKPSGGRLETAGPVPATGKPPSLSSFDSGFDCAGSSHLDVGNGNCNGRESLRPKSLRPRVHELFTSVSDSEEHQGFESGSVESPFAPSIQIIPKITVDSLNFEIKVKRTSTLPKNPWLGLPVEDLENSYTVTITPNTSHHRDSGSPSLSKSDCGDASGRCRDRPAQTDVWAVDPKAKALHPQESFEDPELSLIHNVLSSTISEPRDVANCTEPSLMWDTYDFHDLGRDPAERLNDLSEVSLSGWELREQEGLREVEKILDRTAGILLEEENVLAQEEMLDCLLKTEHSSKPWMSWGNEQSSVEVMNGSADREMYIGHDAQHMRGVLTLKHPMKNGIVQNWDEMERIWHHAFQQLNAEPDEHPVMLTEAAMNPRENRQRMVELMFEAFCVPLTYVAMQAVLALYAAGRTTGVVFDSGDGVSHSVPVFDGYCLPHAVQRFNLAGMDVTLHLTKLLQERGVSMRTSAELEIVRDIKEKHCYVSLDHEAELARGRAVYYTMPDGQVINLVTERFRAPEILFKPELIGREHYGIHESIFKSILQSDIDLRRSLVGNVVLSGGNTLLAGLPERLQTELKKMAPGDLGNCVRVTSPIDRDFSVWSGGAVLANLPSFSSAWISQEEYDEFGPEIVFRKCF
uniref:CRAL-TRIO domain-containing protein n=1 Tax=Denticeps clupeoides TaxID=299321 RepID=A0AAY4DFG1_9TELE